MAQAASVVRGRDGRDGRDGMVNSWSLARFVPVCLEVSRSFFQKEKKLPNFCPATYLVKVPEGSWSRSKHGKVWRFHMIWYIYMDNTPYANMANLRNAAQAAAFRTEHRTVLKSTGPSHGSTPPTKRAT
jgi:hypothetical protein